MKNKKYKVVGMSCAACVARVERAVNAVENVESCEVNLLLGTMSVAGEADEKTVIDAVSRAGYSATIQNDKAEQGSLKSTDEDDGENKLQRRSMLSRLISSSVVLAVLMYISMGAVMWGFPLPKVLMSNPISIAILELLLCSLIMVINKHFFINGAKGIVRLAPNMDTLVALGSFVSYAYSIVMLFVMSHKVLLGNIESANHILHGLYFESAAMILVLITVGKSLEAIAKGKTTSAIKSLMNLSPKMAVVIRDGEEVRISAKEIRVGDVFIVKRGENIASDGVIVEGEISVDESALTGESIPVDKSASDKVLGATSVTSGYAKVRAEKVGEETAIAEIIRMVKEASGSKAPVAKAADRVAGIFVPAIIAISIITFCIWMLLKVPLADALSRAVTVLVISCPCALGLATPVAIMVGSGVGARHGILFKNASALEMAGKIKAVAFDKTGTITEGKPEVSDIVPMALGIEELMQKVIALESKSEHPLALAISDYRKENSVTNIPESSDFEASAGGVSAIVAGKRIYGGNLKFINKSISKDLSFEDLPRFTELSALGKTVLIFASDKEILGLVAITDRINEESQAAISELNSLGIETVMITGDNKRAAQYVAERVGIKRAISEVLPADKAAEIQKLRLSEGRVAMVGDGINDSVALTEADLGIAIGKGADAAIDSADVVLTRGSIYGVVSAIKLGRKTLINIYQNLFWAFCYNIVGIPLAAGAFISLFGWRLEPMFGALAMSISSVLVVTNALRLNLFNPNKHIDNENKDIQKETKTKRNGENKAMNTVTIKIEGMMCPHCSGRVKSALEASSLVASADVSHERGDAVIVLTSSVSDEAVSTLKAVINEAGYKTL